MIGNGDRGVDPSSLIISARDSPRIELGSSKVESWSTADVAVDILHSRYYSLFTSL